MIRGVRIYEDAAFSEVHYDQIIRMELWVLAQLYTFCELYVNRIVSFIHLC